MQSSSWYAEIEARDQGAPRQRFRDIALSRPRLGYLRVLKREGWPVGKTRVYRLYRLEDLQLRMKGQAAKTPCPAARQGVLLA